MNDEMTDGQGKVYCKIITQLAKMCEADRLGRVEDKNMYYIEATNIYFEFTENSGHSETSNNMRKSIEMVAGNFGLKLEDIE